MNTDEINEILKDYKDFIGTFPADNIPLVANTPAAVIVNTDTKEEKGEHWTAIFIPKNRVCEYFDPFGFPPLIDPVQKFLDKTCSSHWVYSACTLQHPLSSLCGVYCVAFIASRFQGLSFESFLSSFTYDLAFNDRSLISSCNDGTSVFF